MRKYPEFVKAAINKLADAIAEDMLADMTEIFEDWQHEEPEAIKAEYPRGMTNKFVVEMFDDVMGSDLEKIFIDVEDGVLKSLKRKNSELRRIQKEGDVTCTA